MSHSDLRSVPTILPSRKRCLSAAILLPSRKSCLSAAIPVAIPVSKFLSLLQTLRAVLANSLIRFTMTCSSVRRRTMIVILSLSQTGTTSFLRLTTNVLSLFLGVTLKAVRKISKNAVDERRFYDVLLVSIPLFHFLCFFY